MDIIQDALALMMSSSGSSPVLDTVKFTVNGTFTPSVGVDGWNEVEVEVLPTLETLSVTSNGIYIPPAGTDGYSAVTVAVSKDFYPKADCELIDVTGVESDTMRVIPTAGTDYYPYLYLASKPYPSQVSDEWTPCDKRYDGQTQEHTVGLFILLMDAATGEAVSGYPKQISQTTYSIVNGGYCRIKNWTVSANASQVTVTITRYNPTYTNPIDTTLTSVSVPAGALDTYLTKPYKVLINQDNTAYTAVSAYWTDFVIQGWLTGGEALNDVVAVKIAATEAIPAGTKIVLRNSTTADYTLTQGLQSGDAVTWADNAITPIIAEVQWSISVDKADGTDWYAPPFTFTLFKKAIT